MASSSSKWFLNDNENNFKKYLSTTDVSQIEDRYRVDGDWKYEFNSLGFRGPEFDPESEFKVFAVGCSYVFGLGLRWEQTFPYLLADRISRLRGKKNFSLMNFGSDGASNDYIARTAISQCQAFKPDLLIVNFTHLNRMELLEDEHIHFFGPWSANQLREIDVSFLHLSNPFNSIVNAIKNILLVQLYCRQNGVNAIFGVNGYHRLTGNSEEKCTEHPVIAPLAALLEIDRMTPGHLSKIDLARDNLHPGPIAHVQYADRHLDRYEKGMYLSANDS